MKKKSLREVQNRSDAQDIVENTEEKRSDPQAKRCPKPGSRAQKGKPPPPRKQRRGAEGPKGPACSTAQEAGTNREIDSHNSIASRQLSKHRLIVPRFAQYTITCAISGCALSIDAFLMMFIAGGESAGD